MADDLMDELSGLDFAAVPPEKFARIVKGLSVEQLGEVMHGGLRARVPGEVVGRPDDRQLRGRTT